MTLKELQMRNPNIPIYDIEGEEFTEYGCKIVGIQTDEIVDEGKKILFPQEGSVYVPSIRAFEALPVAEEIRKKCFGELPVQLGYCYGHNRFLNGWEWHASSEINIAVTDLVLILAKKSEIKSGRIDSGAAKAFLLKAGDVVEIYATSLHFCPCEVEEKGFGCVVGLPVGTNIPLEEPAKAPFLFRKNKWLIAHIDNSGLIEKGVVPGISGINIEIK